MLLIRSILLVAFMIFLFLVMGQLVTYKKEKQTEDICLNFIMGFLGSVGLFWVLYLVFLAISASFTTLVVVYSLAIIALGGLSIYINKGVNFCNIHSVSAAIKSQPKFERIYMVMFFAILVVLMILNGITTAGEQTYDDAEYLVAANDAIHFDSIITRRPDDGAFASYNVRNALNSWNYFIAYFAKIFNIRVTVVSHTILAVLLLFIAFTVYYYIASKLFADSENRWVFLVLLSVLYLFGSYSHYSPTFRLLASIWQHKGVLYAIVLPFTVAVLPYLLEKKNAYIETISICAATCSLSLMGTGLAAVVWGAMFVMTSIKNKKITGFRYVCIVAVISALQLLAFLLIRRASHV